MLDHMSGGRIEIGFGRGSVPFEISYYGQNAEERQQIYAERLELILKAFTVKTLDGKEVPFKSFASGKPVLVDFWATWCAPCVSAMPELQKLHQRHAAKGFSVVGISIDEEQRKARKFAEKKKLAYPVYLDATKTPAWSVFHVRVIPAVFLVDAEGRIVQQWLGKVDMNEVEQAVAKLVG